MTVHGSWTLDRLVEAYTQHQRRTRGLRSQTLRGRARLVRMLVRAALGADPAPQPLRFTAPINSSTFWKPSDYAEYHSRNGPRLRGLSRELRIVRSSA